MKIKADPTVVLKAFKISQSTISDLHKLKIKVNITEAGATFSIPAMGKQSPLMKVAIPPSVLQLAIDGKLQPMSLQNISGNIAQAINKMVKAGLEKELEDKLTDGLAEKVSQSLEESMIIPAEIMEDNVVSSSAVAAVMAQKEKAAEIFKKAFATGKPSVDSPSTSKYPSLRDMKTMPGLYYVVGGEGGGAYKVIAVGEHEAIAMRYYKKKLQIICEFHGMTGIDALSNMAMTAANSAGMSLKYDMVTTKPCRTYLALDCPSKLLAAKAVGAVLQEHVFYGCEFVSAIPDPSEYLK